MLVNFKIIETTDLPSGMYVICLMFQKIIKKGLFKSQPKLKAKLKTLITQQYEYRFNSEISQNFLFVNDENSLLRKEYVRGSA